MCGNHDIYLSIRYFQDEMENSSQAAFFLSIHLARCDEPNPFILLDRQDWQIELCHSCHMPSFDARWCALWWLSCVFIFFLFIWVSLWRTTIYFSHFLSCWISFGPQNSFCLEKKNGMKLTDALELFHCTCDEIYMKLVRVRKTNLFIHDGYLNECSWSGTLGNIFAVNTVELC